MHNDQIERYETIDIEEVIGNYNPQNIETKLPDIETDDEATMMVMHSYSGEPLEMLDPELHGQIDPSYQ